jgi:hypothetical protein
LLGAGAIVAEDGRRKAKGGMKAKGKGLKAEGKSLRRRSMATRRIACGSLILLLPFALCRLIFYTTVAGAGAGLCAPAFCTV